MDDDESFEDRARELDALLLEARCAAEANDEAALTALAERLATFSGSVPDTGEMASLARIADETAERIRKEGVEGKLDAIAARAAELKALRASA